MAYQILPLATIAYVALLRLLLPLRLRAIDLGYLHVGAIAELSLLVLEVCVVRGVGPTGKVVVVAHDVVVGRGGC